MSYKATVLCVPRDEAPCRRTSDPSPSPPHKSHTLKDHLEIRNALDTSKKAGSHHLDLDLELGFVASAMPREGFRMWGKEPFTAETMRHVEALMLKGRPSTAPYLSLYRAFLRWRGSRGLLSYSQGRTAAIFGAYLCDAGLKFNPAATYVRMVLVFLHRETYTTPPEWHIAEDLLRGIDLEAAGEEPDHAPDITEEYAAHVIETIKAPDVAFVIWAMCILGGRVCDLLRLRKDQVTVRGTRVAVDFRVTKTSREHSERYSYTLSYGDPAETHHHVDLEGWIPFREEWRPFLSQEHPFSANANRVNKILHKAGFPETTYSFRRLFINRIIDRFTENGVRAWCKVIQITGHQQAKNLEASYKKSAAKRLREAAF